jgi:hypothetical protein
LFGAVRFRFGVLSIALIHIAPEIVGAKIGAGMRIGSKSLGSIGYRLPLIHWPKVHATVKRLLLLLLSVLSLAEFAPAFGQTTNWSNGEQQNYIPVNFLNSRGFNPAKDDGYVHFQWTCPSSAQLRALGEAIVNRTVLGTLFGSYNGTYIVTAKWVGNGTLQPNTLDQVLLSFEYNQDANPRVKLRNTCAALFPQNLNYNTSIALTVGVAKTQQIGISNSLAGPIAVLGRISGLFLASTPGAFTDLTSAFQVVTTNKASLDTFFGGFGQSIGSESDFTFEPETQRVRVLIGDATFTLQKTWLPTVVYRSGNPSTVSEQLFLQRTGVSLASVKSSISSTFRADIETPALFSQRCSAYHDKLFAMGLTDADAALLLWAELANHPGLTTAACFTPRDVQLLSAMHMAPPYKGAY